MSPLSRSFNSNSIEKLISEYIKFKKKAFENQQPKTTKIEKGICISCKGSKFLCGRSRCPLLVKTNYFLKTISLISNKEISGFSPPSVFIGRIGYPYVYAGPLVPPIYEDTGEYDKPEKWFGKSIDEIVGFRSLLIRGKKRVHVTKFR